MSNYVATFQGSAAAAVNLQNESFTIYPGAVGSELRQIIMLNGSVWTSAAGRMLGVTMTIKNAAGAQVAQLQGRIFANFAADHVAFVPGMQATTLAAGSYTYSIVSSNADTIWDSNDFITVSIIEMEHAGVGGGM